MDAFIRVLRKEKYFIIIFAILNIIDILIGGESPLGAFLDILSCFIIVTIAHDEYASIVENIVCILLATFPLFATCVAGVNINTILTLMGLSVFTGLFLRGLRFLMRKLRF